MSMINEVILKRKIILEKNLLENLDLNLIRKFNLKESDFSTEDHRTWFKCRLDCLMEVSSYRSIPYCRSGLNRVGIES